MFIWCLISVILDHSNVETAASGQVLNETGYYYVIDFAEYAKKQSYEGNYSRVIVEKDSCMEVGP